MVQRLADLLQLGFGGPAEPPRLSADVCCDHVIDRAARENADRDDERVDRSFRPRARGAEELAGTDTDANVDWMHLDPLASKS